MNFKEGKFDRLYTQLTLQNYVPNLPEEILKSTFSCYFQTFIDMCKTKQEMLNLVIINYTTRRQYLFRHQFNIALAIMYSNIAETIYSTLFEWNVNKNIIKYMEYYYKNLRLSTWRKCKYENKVFRWI